MNETRNIIAGLELGKEFSQICYYDRKEKEPVSFREDRKQSVYIFHQTFQKAQDRSVALRYGGGLFLHARGGNPGG